MTDFGTLEASVEDSRPIEVIEITLGSEVFRYTSAEDDLTIDGDLFEAIPINRNQVIVGSDQQRRTLTVTVPATNSFARNYIDIIPGERAEFSLFRYQRDESPAFDTRILLFSGRVQSVKFSNDGQNAAINVRSIEAALSRNLPRITFMGMCGAFLYDRFCGANPASFNHIGAVTLVSGSDITVTGAGALSFPLESGYVRPTGENDYRMILSQTGDVLTLLLPFQNDPTGANVQVFGGCDHLIDGHCATVYDRVIDFVGFAFVPNKNIFQTGVPK